MDQETVVIDVDGATGTKTSRRVLTGYFAGVVLKYTGQPGSCVVKLTEVESGIVITTITGNANRLFIPTVVRQRDTQADIPQSGGNRSSNRNDLFPVYGRVRVDVSAGQSGQVEAMLRWE